MEIDEDAIVFNSRDNTIKGITYFGCIYETFNNLNRPCDSSGILTGDAASTVIIKINLYASLCNDLINLLSSFTDNDLDLVWIYMDYSDLWCCGSKLRSRLIQYC